MAAAALLMACGGSRDADPRLVSAWMRSLYGTILVERLSPPVASRLAAYSTVALYSGVIAGRPTDSALAGVLNALPALPRSEAGPDYDATLVAVEAERVALDSLLFEGLPTTRAAAP